MSTPEDRLQELQARVNAYDLPTLDEDTAVLEDAELLDEAATDPLELQKTEALARAKEKAAALDRVDERAKNLNNPAKEYEHGAAVGIANTLGMPVDAVSGILTASGFPTNAPLGSGDNIMDVFEALGIVPGDMPAEAIGGAGGAGEYMGTAAVLAPAMLAPFLQAAAMSPGQYERHVGLGRTRLALMPEGTPKTRAAKAAFIIKQLGEQAARTAAENPKSFLASELAISGITGAVGQELEEAGATPGQRMGAELGAGIASALTLQGIPRLIRSGYRWGMANMLPMTEEGGMLRAGAQMQARAEDIPRALKNIDAAPEGVTAARATEDPRLMGQEALILEANPSLDLQVREDLTNATRRAQRDLRDLYDTPRGKSDWDYAVVNRVNPEGTPEVQSGAVEDMVDQVYNNFGPLYDEVKGFPVRLHLMDRGRKTTLRTMLENVPETSTVVAGDPARATVGRWLKGQAEDLFRRAKEIDGSPAVMSEDLLQLRSKVREQQRKALKAARGAGGTEAADRAALFEVAEARINQLIKEQLPEEAQQLLRSTDEQYRNFKIIDNAVWRSPGDKGLTPDSLLASIKDSASSRGAYTRGEQMELRSVAHAGREIDSYINQPTLAARYTENMSPEDLANTQSQFMDSLLRRSISSNVDYDGNEIIDASKLLGNLNKFARTAEAIGISPDDVGRVRVLGQQLRAMQNLSKTAVTALFEDGPSNVVQLLGALSAARTGTAAAKAVKGNPLVLAGFFTNKMRNFLAKLTSDKATELMIAAAQPTEEGRALYKALLTQPNALPKVQTEAARYLNTWLVASARNKEEDLSYKSDLERLKRDVGIAESKGMLN